MTQMDLLLMCKKLGCTPEEAAEILAEDAKIDKMTATEAYSDLTPEQRKAVKSATITGSKKRVPVKRERKIDQDKAVIMDILNDALIDNEILIHQITEGETQFEHNGNQFTVRLIKHRPPKK